MSELRYPVGYAMDSRKLYLIAANFVEDKQKRALDYEIR